MAAPAVQPLPIDPYDDNIRLIIGIGNDDLRERLRDQGLASFDS
jgi:hypothetical protein